jgi:hypothetical protein
MVELRGNKSTHCVGFSLASNQEDSSVQPLVACIMRDVLSAAREPVAVLTGKVVEDGVRASHGCIIAVVADTDEAIASARHSLTDGAFLSEPIDLAMLVRESEEQRSRESSTLVRSRVSLIRGMIGQDGITLFSTRGRVLAFNVFIPNVATASVMGGARSRAFATLAESGLVIACFAQSHDGGVKFWKAP